MYLRYIIGVMILFLGSAGYCVANEGDIRINELAWMGTKESYSNEWIEIKNTGNTEVDLSGWKLKSKDDSPNVELTGTIKSGGLVLLERTDEETVPNKSAEIIYTGSLGNSGETVEVINDNGEVVDQVQGEKGWPAGDNDSKQTMIYCNGWISSPEAGGSPKEKNSCNNQEEENIEKEETGSEETKTVQKDTKTTTEKEYNRGDVLINEFISDPAENKEEWVEIKNVSGQEINTKDWYLEEGSGSRTQLPDKTFSSGDLLVIREIKGYLNNKGDVIKLKGKEDKVVDKVVYGEWEGQEKEVSSPSSSVAAARNEQDKFVLTQTPTPGKKNVVDQKESKKQQEGSSSSSGLIITEVLPNPKGKEKQEFIELYNKSEESIELKGWKLTNELGQVLEFDPASIRSLGIEKEKIGSGKHFVLYKKHNRLVLNDSGGRIQLFSPGSRRAVQTIEYEKAPPGVGYVDTDHINVSRMSSSTRKFFAYSMKAKRWIWSERSTPGGYNQIKRKNKPPHPLFSFFGEQVVTEEISFDGSDSFDENGDNLSYRWDFGDGVTVKGIKRPTHVYLEPGEYEVSLFVSDREATSSLSKKVEIKSEKGKNTSEESSSSEDENSSVVINEILPVPEQEEGGSWVELRNKGSRPINIEDWKIANNEFTYPISRDSSIAPKEIYLVEEDGRQWELEEREEFVKLVDKKGIPVDKVEYKRAFVGESLAKGKNGSMFWTTTPTPHKENKITVKGSKQTVSTVPDLSLPHPEKGEEKVREYPPVKLEEIHSLDQGVKVSSTGTVVVRPGVLGQQYFYISGSPGVQIYSFDKQFPSIQRGDKIEVKGEISESRYGEKRVNIHEEKDIKVLDHSSTPEAKKKECSKIGEKDIGSLMITEGRVKEMLTSKIKLNCSGKKDPASTFLIYLQEEMDISAQDIQEGGVVRVTGIVGGFKEGVRLLPRGEKDIEQLKKERATSSRVQGTSTVDNTSTIWNLSSQKKEEKGPWIYLLAALGTVIVISFVLLLKRRS